MIVLDARFITHFFLMKAFLSLSLAGAMVFATGVQ